MRAILSTAPAGTRGASGHADNAPVPVSERVREVRERLLAAGRVRGSAGGRWHELAPVAIGRRESEELLGWVRREGAQRTLEAGLGCAIGTLAICQGLLESGAGGHHVAADPYQLSAPPQQRTSYGGVGLEILEEAGVRSLVEFYAEESQIVFPRLLAEGRRFDLAFVDGNHRFESVFLDLAYCGRLLEEGGIVFVDDTQLPGVRRAVDFCLRNLGWTSEDAGEEGAHHEWRVLRTGSPEAYRRPYDQLADL
jgi:hypothetical protein